MFNTARWIVIVGGVVLIGSALIGCNGTAPDSPAAQPDPAPAAKADADPPVSAASLAEQAQQKLQAAELEPAIELADQALQMDADHDQALRVAADANQIKGIGLAQIGRHQEANVHLHRSARMIRRLAEVRELTPEEVLLRAGYVYNEACCFAVENQVDKAFATLDEAVSLGFKDLPQLESDSDLESLRADQRYQQLVARIQSAVDKPQ